MDAIFQTIQRDMKSELERIAFETAPRAETDSDSVQRAEHEQSIANVRSRIRRLYEDLVSGILDSEEYAGFKAQYEAVISEHEAKIKEIYAQQKATVRTEKRRKQLSRDAATLKQAPKLTQELIDRLVERVEVTPEKVVHVQLRIQEDGHD